MNTRVLGGLTALIVLLTGNLAAAPLPLELKWTELAPLISGRIVTLTEPGGATITGGIAAIREDMLVMDVMKSSDVKAFPKGNANIPRASVNLLEVQELRYDPKGRMIAMAFAPAPFAGLAIARHYSFSPGATYGMIGGFGGAALLAGELVIHSRKNPHGTQIRVIP